MLQCHLNICYTPCCPNENRHSCPSTPALTLYEEILVIKETYPHAFKVFIGEFAFRIQNDKYIRGLYLTYRDRFECKAFDLL